MALVFIPLAKSSNFFNKTSQIILSDLHHSLLIKDLSSGKQIA